MGQPINVEALLKVQPRIKSELSSHVVRRNPKPVDDFYQLGSLEFVGGATFGWS